MKILFLFPYPTGSAASQRFRFEQYLSALEEEGIQYELQPFLDEASWRIFYKRGHFVKKMRGLLKGKIRRLSSLFRLSQFDYVFIHREAFPVGPPVFEWTISRLFKKKIIYDFDDAIWIANSSESNRFFAPLKSHSNAFRICSYAYCISVGNNYLANAARPFNKQVVVNPTTIDTIGLHNQVQAHDQKTLTIGWTGSHSTLKYLDVIFPVIRRIKAIRNIRFIIISDEQPADNQDLFEFVPWNRATEIEDLMQINIGLMPLTADQWSEGKCGFKALQYMALGIPALVSPIGVNNEIVKNGENGFICDSEQVWEDIILKLLDNRELLNKVGKWARKTVEDRYSVRSNKSNFLHLFT